MKKPKVERAPDVADEVPWSDNITPYDDQHTITYFRLLDADVEGADWQEVARIVQHSMAETCENPTKSYENP